MTLRTSRGESLNDLYRSAMVKAMWIRKLNSNLRDTLNRLAGVVTLGPSSLRPGNNIVLYYDGSAEAKTRIEKVLEISLTDGVAAPTKISRLTVNVVLLQQRQRRAA